MAKRNEPQAMVKKNEKDTEKELGFIYANPPVNESAWPDRFGRLLSEWAQLRNTGSLQTLSLFTGCGGLDIGFHDAGFQIHTMVEKDAACLETLKANTGRNRYFGETDVRGEDVRLFKLPVGRKVDFVIGSPPCQTFSAASRRINGVNGTGEERGTLFKAYIRLLLELSPEAFLFENVAGITSAQNGTAWSEIVIAFQEAGYRVFYRVLDAADYGVPQHRERMFLVGLRGQQEYRFPAPTHGPDSPAGITFHNARAAFHGVVLTDQEKHARPKTRFSYLLDDIPPGLNYSFYTDRMGHPRPLFAWRSKFSDFLYKADPNHPVRTLKADGGSCTGPFHWDSRLFAARELTRLQTIPDHYILRGGRGAIQAQIGNAVPCQLARLLALSVLGQIFGKKLPFEINLLTATQHLGFRRRKLDLRHLYEQKAADAIARLGRVETLLRGRSYRARLTNKLGWVEDQKGNLEVKFTIHDKHWKIHVSACTIDQYAFKIAIRPTKGISWPPLLNQVSLTGDILTEECFTGAWKAFEAELVRLDVKADLVQLCGYHSYTPAMQCEMNVVSFPNPKFIWKAVLRVVEGNGVGKIMAEAEIAKAWSIPPKKIQTAARYLKQMGFEVRSKNTNTRIPQGNFLVPYSFPTLNPKSIQLYKEL